MRLPESFCERTRALLGDERWSVLEHALGEQPTVSVRYNPWKQPGWQADGWQIDGRVPWCPDGLYLKERPSFTFDPLFHMGKYYVQEASSMFVSHVVRQLAGILENQEPTVLDMCAAPGGKSTAMISALPQGSLLFANEPIRLRANILSENLSKFGYPHVVVTNNYPKDYGHRRVVGRACETLQSVAAGDRGKRLEGTSSRWFSHLFHLYVQP